MIGIGISLWSRIAATLGVGAKSGTASGFSNGFSRGFGH
jgi:hypothetical protein